MTVKRTFILPDLQVPYVDSDFFKRMLRVIRAYKPDQVIQIGDLIDLPEVSRWHKGKHLEYAATLQGSLDMTRSMLTDVRRAAPNADLIVKEGNHDLRFAKYIADYAPALASLRSSDLAEQLGLEGLGVRYERKPFEAAPGVLVLHGHERAYSSISGKYELERIRQHGMSVITGHTHTPVLVTTAQAVGFEQKHYFGMNVGHAMDIKKVSYVGDGYLNWCQGFGLLETDESGSYPTLVTAPNGHFRWRGHSY
jgi:metallophosphoesterase superfamily enzyme